MEEKINATYWMTGAQAVGEGSPIMPSLHLLTMCIIVMQNGFTIIGKSAPASAANFNAELGRKLAYEDAIRQLWPLEGYALGKNAGKHAMIQRRTILLAGTAALAGCANLTPASIASDIPFITNGIQAFAPLLAPLGVPASSWPRSWRSRPTWRRRPRQSAR